MGLLNQLLGNAEACSVEKAAEAGELIPDTIDGFEIPDVPDASMDPTRISDIEFEVKEIDYI